MEMISITKLLDSDEECNVKLGIELSANYPALQKFVERAQYWLDTKDNLSEGSEYKFSFDDKIMIGYYEVGISHPGGHPTATIEGFVTDEDDYPYLPEDCDWWQKTN